MCAFPISRGAAAPLLAALLLTTPLRADSPPSVRVDLGGGQTLEMVLIAPGTFQQGSPAGEAGRGADETQRTVTLTRAFYLGKYPVTRGQFARFVAETGYRTEAESGPSGGFGWDGTQLKQRKDFTWKNPGFAQTDAHPVTTVSYKDADAFVRWLSRKSGRTRALPSEAQWEYAARAGASNPPVADDVAWHKGNSGNATHAVEEKPANAWGVGDLLGNVWEWCEDWYAPYDAADVRDPVQRNANLSDKPRRVLRGGSWSREAKFCRPAARYRNDALSRNGDNGFRVMTFDMEVRPSAPPPPPVRQPPVELEAPSAGKPSAFTTPKVAGSMHFQPAPVVPRGASFSWLMGIPFVGVFLLIVIMIIRAIAKSVGTSSGGFGGGLPPTSSVSGQPLRVRIGEDGFWIVGDGVSAGTEIACRYTANGAAQSIDVRYEPGPDGQFVFTGSRPSNVTVSTASGGMPGSFGSTTSRRFGNTMGMGQSIVPDPPFRGHPPAY